MEKVIEQIKRMIPRSKNKYAREVSFWKKEIENYVR